MKTEISSRDHANLYIGIVEQILSSDSINSLPSLPGLVLEIRRSIDLPNATARKIAATIRNDPGLTALLFKYAASPVCKSVAPVTSLEGVISRVGFTSVANMAMLHSLRGMFVAKSPQLKSLYQIVWRRQVIKAGLACFLAARFGINIDSVLIQSLMTEVGSLAILMALKDCETYPDRHTYIDICRKYSKPVGIILLTKWGLERSIIEAVEKGGRWFESEPGVFNHQDVLNLSLYQTVLWTEQEARLPPFQTLALFKKLPENLRELEEGGGLVFLAHHQQQVDDIVQSLGGQALGKA